MHNAKCSLLLLCVCMSLRMLCFHYSHITSNNIRSIGEKKLCLKHKRTKCMNFLFSEQKKNRKRNQMCLQCRFTHIFHNGILYHLRMSWLLKVFAEQKKWIHWSIKMKRNITWSGASFSSFSLLMEYHPVYNALINEHVKYDGFADDAWQRTIVCVHIIVKQLFIEFVSVHQRRQFTYSILTMSLYLKNWEFFFANTTKVGAFFFSILSLARPRKS